MESSAQMIKPCRVQITDLRKMKNRDNHFTEAIDERDDKPSTSTSSGKEPAQGACTVLIVPNQETSTSTGIEEVPSEGTMLIVSEDGWIKGEPKSPEGLGQTVDGGKSTTDNDQHSLTAEESDYDIDVHGGDDSDSDENDGDYDDDDWIPDPGSDSDEENEQNQAEPGRENTGAESTPSVVIDPNEKLSVETLKSIMQVVYGVPKPNVSTLLMLKEQMDERPKLKVKLLKDLQRGNSMFKKRRERNRSIVVRRQFIETPSPVNETQSQVNKTPSQVNEFLRQVNETPSQGNITPSQANETPSQGNITPSQANETPSEVKVNDHIPATEPQWTPHEPLTLAKAKAHLAAHCSQRIKDNSASKVASIPVPSTIPNIAVTPSFVSSVINAPPPGNPVTPPENYAAQETPRPWKTIIFKDKSHPSTRAVFMPEKRTVNIPELPPGPPGSVDVLVPVDAEGQMKEPFMGIPLDSCKLVFGSNSEEATNGPPSKSLKDEKQSMPASTQSYATPPPAGVFPNPQSATAASVPKPGVQPTPAPFPPRMLPPGMVPVGLVPASANPSGAFPSHMFPPGSIPAGMVAVPLPPDAMRFPVPGPHVKCTCPPGSRPPGPPVHSLVHIQPQDLNRLSATGGDSPAVSHQGRLPDEGNESPLTTSNNSRPSSPGIKIASVRSCTSDEDPVSKASGSPNATSQAGATASGTAAAPGMANHPGSLLTVILPKSAQEHYKHKLNPQSKSNPLIGDLREIHNPATKIDLGLVWNEISLIRTEIHAIKNKVASDIHNIRTDMEEFVKLVGTRLGITPATHPNNRVQGYQGGNEGGKKRKERESDGEEQNANKHPKVSSE